MFLEALYFDFFAFVVLLKNQRHRRTAHNQILRNIEKGQGACGLRANLGCPAAAVSMRVLRGRAPLASCASMRRRGAELNAKFHHQLTLVSEQATNRSCSSSVSVALQNEFSHFWQKTCMKCVVRWKSPPLERTCRRKKCTGGGRTFGVWPRLFRAQGAHPCTRVSEGGVDGQ